jgi:2-methylcitrate dehydratase PrpD
MTRSTTDFIHDLCWDDLTPEIRSFARRWLLDLIGVAAAATGTELSRIIRGHSAAHFGAGAEAARMLFDGRRVSPVGAALAGGMTIDALDAHDGHKLTKGHVGCGVLPALLAMSDATNSSGRDGAELLTALVLGYEIGTRAGIALHRTACDYHTSGAWVAVAAAALGARALELDHTRTFEALGIAEYHGPRSQMMRCIDHPTMVKDGSGWGAMAGISAAYLAAGGFTGAPARLVTGDEVAPLWADLGQRWCIFEQYYKPYPVCRWAQPSVTATRHLMASHKFAADEIETLEISTFHQAIRLAVRHPNTTEEAQYSTAYPVAAALVRGVVGPDEVAPEALGDARINAMADRIVFAESDAFNAAFPANRFAQVTITLKTGQSFSSEPTEASGDPECPASTHEVRAKFHAYADPVLGRARADAIEAEIEALDRERDTAALFDLILTPVAAR